MANTHEQALERAKLVKDWAMYTAARLEKSIIKKKIGIATMHHERFGRVTYQKSSGALVNSLAYAVVSAANGDVDSTRHEFNYYGKFVDMGVGRGQKIENVKSNGDILRLTGEGRRPKKWFSRTYWAEVTELRDLLMVKYGTQSAQLIKETLE
jgi:hypothetical protein